MSLFLGPVHHWLFKKVLIVEERERFLVREFTEKFGNRATPVAEEMLKKYGEHFDQPLEKLIGNLPIHEFLADSIERVETREAAIIKRFIEEFGEEAKSFAVEVAYRHGRKKGEEAVEEYGVRNPVPEKVYTILRNFFLDGMPCDHVVEIEQKPHKEFVEIHKDCLHQKYWQNAGVEENLMCEYLSRWVDGFCDAIDGIKHVKTKSIAKGDSLCEDRWLKTKGE